MKKILFLFFIFFSFYAKGQYEYFSPIYTDSLRVDSNIYIKNIPVKDMVFIQYSQDSLSWSNKRLENTQYIRLSNNLKGSWTYAIKIKGDGSGGSIVGSFLDLNDTPSSYESYANKFVKVNVDEDGLEFVESSVDLQSNVFEYTDNTFKPFITKKGSNPGYPYFYTQDVIPSYTNSLLLDGNLESKQFKTRASFSVNRYSNIFNETSFSIKNTRTDGITVENYLGQYGASLEYNTSTSNNFSFIGFNPAVLSLEIYSSDDTKDLPIRLGYYNNLDRGLKVDAGQNKLNVDLEVNMSQGVANKWLKLNANKNIEFVDAPAATAVWGSITGTLSDQTDLQNALNGKVNLTGNETIGGQKIFSSPVVSQGTGVGMSINEMNSNSTASSLIFFNNSSIKTSFGFNQFNDETYIWNQGSSHIKFGINNTEGFRFTNLYTFDVKKTSSHPSVPAIGFGRFYVYEDKPYFKDVLGNQYDLTASGGSSKWTNSAVSGIYNSGRVAVGGDVLSSPVAQFYSVSGTSGGWSTMLQNTHSFGHGLFIKAASGTGQSFSVADVDGVNNFNVYGNGNIFMSTRIGNSTSGNILYFNDTNGKITYGAPVSANIDIYALTTTNTGEMTPSYDYLALSVNSLSNVTRKIDISTFAGLNIFNANKLQGRSISSTAPSSNQVLKWNGSTWAPADESGSGGGMIDPMTTRGDIIYRNSSNTTTRLGRGTSGQVLTSDGTDISWQTPSSGGTNPLAIIKRASSQDFKHPHAMLRVGSYLFVSERVNNNSEYAKVAKYNVSDLTLVGTVQMTSIGYGSLESMCYDPVNDKIYALRTIQAGGLSIISINPSNLAISEIINTGSLDAGISGAICTDGTYIYGVTYKNPARVFRCTVAGGSLTSVEWTGADSGHGIYYESRTNQVLATSHTYAVAADKFAKINPSTLSISDVDVISYAYKATDDFAVIDDGSEVWVFIGGEQATGGYAGARVQVSNLAVTPLTIQPTYAVSSYGDLVYSTSISGYIQVFSRHSINDISSFKLPTGMIPNEITFSSEGRLFITVWDNPSRVLELDLGSPELLGTGLTNPMTTTGDIIVAASGGIPTRLAASASGYVLTSNGVGNAPSWQVPSGGGSGGASPPTTITTSTTNLDNGTNHTHSLDLSGRSVSTSGSLTGGGNLGSNRTLSLVNDNSTPGNNKYYGTDGSGSKGFFDVPGGGGGGWTDDGTTVRLTTSSDNVAIGTSSAGTNKLLVDGTTYLQGNVITTGYIYIDDKTTPGSSNFGRIYQKSDGKLYYKSNDSNSNIEYDLTASSSGMSNPMTTTGDIIYSSSGTTPARRAIGTTGQVLTVSGGLPVWQDAPNSAGTTWNSSTSELTIQGIVKSDASNPIFIFRDSDNGNESSISMNNGITSFNSSTTEMMKFDGTASVTVNRPLIINATVSTLQGAISRGSDQRIYVGNTSGEAVPIDFDYHQDYGTRTSTTTHDFLKGSSGSITLSTSNITININNIPDGESGTLLIKQSTGTARAITINAYSDGGSTSLTKVTIGTVTSISSTLGKYSTVTFKRFGNVVTLVFGRES